MTEPLAEATERSELLLLGTFLHVRRDWVRLPDGAKSVREYVRHPGATVIVPWLEARDELVLVRQWRHPLSRVFLEFPAGKLDPGEAPLECARRELAEETGYRATRLAYLGVMHNAIAYSDEAIHMVLAAGLVPGSSTPDDGEFIEPALSTREELHRQILEHKVTDAKTITALYWFEQFRLGKVNVEWCTV